MTDSSYNPLREAAQQLVDSWCVSGLPSRQQLDAAFNHLNGLRERLNISGLWERSPTMVTATLDDGIGQGLAVIENCAAAIGIRLISSGLMRSPEAISDACRRHQPDWLGVTVLQFDSEDDLKWIAQRLPCRTRIVAGGPVFSADPGFAQRTGVYYAARNVADFLQFMLDR
jgi:methylmalonyl-CoA mutase cobalamin-binding subunit